VERSSVTRWAAPVAFLLAITIGALVVRAGFEHGRHHPKTPTTTTTSKRKKSHAHGHRRQHPTEYTIQTHDTLSTIAAKYGTTVAELEHLNPGIDPQALHVGEKIRVQ
jgi:LysM repeat protein